MKDFRELAVSGQNKAGTKAVLSGNIQSLIFLFFTSLMILDSPQYTRNSKYKFTETIIIILYNSIYIFLKLVS